MSESVYDFTLPLLNSEPDTGKPTLSLGELRGQLLLLVNTASYCGFTSQYAGLEALYRRYKERGFAVLGFPCNQFGAQEPGSAKEIGTFCDRSFGVTFPLFAPIEVNGGNAHPLYRYLKQQKPGMFGIGRISWNFTKFLVDRNGRVVARYSPSTKPEKLVTLIEKLLEGNEAEPGRPRQFD